MTNTILCPHCGKEVEVTEAFKHQIEQDIVATLGSKHKQELEEVKIQAIQKAKESVVKEMETTLKDRENESKELQEQNRNLQTQLLEVNKLIRLLKTKDEQRELEMQKILTEEREKVKEELAKHYADQHRLKDLEKEKKIHDMELLVEELKRKAEQGSMQTQGEVLELDVERLLTDAFPHDTVEPVGKGVTGADIRHIVKSPRGTICGVILWELKRTKSWSNEWIPKLKTDLRAEQANIPALVSQVLPDEAKGGIGMRDGVWVCGYPLLLPMAMLLRKNLLDVGYQKAVQANRGEKADLIYSYITSHEFVQQIEMLVEVYKEINDQIGSERVVFEKNWKKRELQMRKILLSAAGIYGSMQGIVGASLPQIRGLEVMELDDGESK